MPEPGEYGYEEPHEDMLNAAQANLEAIAKWASEARTALDDPGGLLDDDEDLLEAIETSETLDRIFSEAAPSPYTLYAIGKLDDIIRLTGVNDDA